MSDFTTTEGERNVADLAARIYGVGARSAAGRRAAEALLELNPELEAGPKLPAGLLVEVPEVEGLEPAIPVGPLADAAPAAVLSALDTGLASVTGAVAELVAASEREAREQVKALKSAPVRKAVRGDKVLMAAVDDAAELAQAEADAAKALASEQRAAFAELKRDLTALRDWQTR
jgi:hypothetical protein